MSPSARGGGKPPPYVFALPVGADGPYPFCLASLDISP